ncbi:MAG TPA: FAD-binding oxidoreductase, partial [Chryseosolibacter sp.]
MNLAALKKSLQGDLFTDDTMRRLYATDASAYRELPLAVAIPKSEQDIITLIQFARINKTSIIPRTAGTSLAGQVVGAGIIVDVSKHFNSIISINKEQGWAIVQPGIVRDDLNFHLKPYGFFFAPETSTANRAMIGGMIGNNSCGSNSVVYGSTREHLLEVEAILSDGSKVHFKQNSEEEIRSKLAGDPTRLETRLYQHINRILSDEKNITEIERQFPKESIERRNTGYAIDVLARMAPYRKSGKPFNFSGLIAGSEGTLAFVTSAKIKLTPLDPPFKKLV